MHEEESAERDPLHVRAADAEQFTGGSLSVAEPPRVEGALAHAHPQRMVGSLNAVDEEVDASAVRPGEQDEDADEHGEPDRELRNVAIDDAAVDDKPDDHRHGNLAQLVRDEQHGRRCQPVLDAHRRLNDEASRPGRLR